MPIDSDTLLRGSLTYLRYARRFQRDAVDLYERGRFSAAVVLSTISLEHTATATWLYDSSKLPDVLESMTSNSLSKQLSNTSHSKIIGRGLRSFFVVKHPERLQEIILKIVSSPVGSEEYAALSTEYDRLTADERTKAPGHIHGFELPHSTLTSMSEPTNGLLKTLRATQRKERL